MIFRALVSKLRLARIQLHSHPADGSIAVGIGAPSAGSTSDFMLILSPPEYFSARLILPVTGRSRQKNTGAPNDAPVSLSIGQIDLVAARAAVDVAAAITVAVVALARLFGNMAENGTRDTTDGSANSSAPRTSPVIAPPRIAPPTAPMPAPFSVCVQLVTASAHQNQCNSFLHDCLPV